jgi:hypothetical protein
MRRMAEGVPPLRDALRKAGRPVPRDGPPGDHPTVSSNTVFKQCLGEFQRHSSVSIATSEYLQRIDELANNDWAYQVECGEQLQFVDEQNTVTNVTTGGHSLLWEVGNSTFFRSAKVTVQAIGCQCCDGRPWPKEYSYTGEVTFEIRDRFANPLDIGIEVPGGTTYPITAKWIVPVSGRGKIETPCD